MSSQLRRTALKPRSTERMQINRTSCLGILFFLLTSYQTLFTIPEPIANLRAIAEISDFGTLLSAGYCCVCKKPRRRVFIAFMKGFMFALFGNSDWSMRYLFNFARQVLFFLLIRFTGTLEARAKPLLLRCVVCAACISTYELDLFPSSLFTYAWSSRRTS